MAVAVTTVRVTATLSVAAVRVTAPAVTAAVAVVAVPVPVPVPVGVSLLAVAVPVGTVVRVVRVRGPTLAAGSAAHRVSVRPLPLLVRRLVLVLVVPVAVGVASIENTHRVGTQRCMCSCLCCRAMQLFGHMVHGRTHAPSRARTRTELSCQFEDPYENALHNKSILHIAHPYVK